MQFNDTTNKSGIVQDINFMLFGSNTMNDGYPIDDIVRNVNQRLNRVVSIIFQNDRRWKYDDFNHLDMNIYYGDTVAGQQDYEIPGSDFIDISELAVMINGKYQILKPLVREKGQKLQYLEEETGVPLYYEKYGNSVLLYPKPDTSTTNGLMLRAKRLPSYFTNADTTKEPGFNPLFHKILSIGGALDYAMPNGMRDKINTYQPELDRLEIAMAEYYSKRSEDEQPRMTLSGGTDYYDSLYQ